MSEQSVLDQIEQLVAEEHRLWRAESEGFTFVELSRLLLVTSGNLTGIVDRLEEQRLVERRPDAKVKNLAKREETGVKESELVGAVQTAVRS